MKNLFFIILLSSLYFVLNIDYELTNGIEKTFSNLVSSQTYNFYIPITQMQKAFITLTFNNLNSLPFSNPYIYEYSSRTSSSYIRRSTAYFSTSTKNGQLIAKEDYLANKYSVSYMALVITPTSNINNMAIKFDIAGGAYEMSEGQYKNIYNLIANYIYFLIIPAKSGHKFTLKLTTDYPGKHTFDHVTVYEFKDTTRQNVLKYIDYYFGYDLNNNEKIISLSYTVHRSETNMIGIRIYPNYNSEYIKALFTLESYIYDLYDEHSKNVSDIKAGNSYKFYYQAKALQIANVSLSIKYNSLYKPFSYINIYENKYPYSSEHIKESTHSISSPLETFIYQMTNNYDTPHLIIEINPNYNFEQLNISINLFDAAFELKNEYSKDIKGLFPGGTYYLIISSTQLQTLNVGIKMEEMTSQPFNSIDIYEYPYKNSPDYNYYENKPISFTRNNNQLETNILYTNSFSFNYYSFYTVFEIKPIKNIKSMSISLDIYGKVFELYDYYPQTFSNLESNNKYYLTKYVEKKQKTYLTIKINNIYQNKPFDNVTIYEYSKNDKIQYFEEINPPTEKDNELVISISYNVKLSSPIKLVFEIIPNYDLDSIEAFIEIKNNNSSDSSIALIIVLSIIIPVIIIIGIFILLRFMKKKNNKIENKQIEEPMNLYPA